MELPPVLLNRARPSKTDASPFTPPSPGSPEIPLPDVRLATYNTTNDTQRMLHEEIESAPAA
jgi:hypothetical protein